MAYDPDYALELMRGVDAHPRPWDLQSEILNVLNSNDELLDIGCRSAVQLWPVARAVRSVVGMEPDPAMRRRAIERVAEAALTNVQIVEGNGEELPYDDSSFDVVTCTMAPHTTEEIHRVLRTGGLAIVEEVGEQDKGVMKGCFPPDESGNKRGQLADLQPNERKAACLEEFKALFSDVNMRQGFWTTFLTPEGIDLLLDRTPTVRDFDPVKDRASVQKVKELCATDQGIKITQHRLLIVAKK